MKINPYQAIAVAIALVAAAILAEVLKPRELMAKQTASISLESSIPREFGEWKLVPGVGVVIPADVVEVADPMQETNKVYSQEVSRTYVNREGHIVMLLVAYGPVQNNRLKAHRPEICYAASGFRISEKFGTTLSLGPNQTINLTRLVTQRETRFEPVTYWMRFGHDIVTGVVDRQVSRIKYGLQGLIPDGALVRFSTVGVNRDQSFAIQDRFIRDFLNAIEPSKRPFFAGAELLARAAVARPAAGAHDPCGSCWPQEAHTFLRLALLTGLLLGFSSAAHSDSHESLLIYGVEVNRTPKQSWGTGNGIYLGHGLVLTAAHVVGRTFWTRPKVIIAGQELSTTTVREGTFEGTDLTLLRIDEQKLPVWLRLRLNPVCKNDPVPGLEVATVARDQLAFSKVVSPTILPPQAKRFNTVIGDVATTGNSGSGVFDLRHKCLLGIMSRKISLPVASSKQMRDIAKYFVPASEIRAFIPSESK